MTEFYREGDCAICEKWFPLLHWHHTIPQSLGGKDSLQIPLCAQCHNLLHAHSLAIVARKKTGRKSHKNFWANPTMEHNAGPYLQILVEAILSDANVVGKQYVMSIKASPALHTALQLFKADRNVSSLEKAMLLAISETLRLRGYLEDEHSKGNQQQGKNGTQRSVSELW